MARLAIFVDGGYLDAITRHQFDGAQIDMQKLSDEVLHTVGGRTPEPVENQWTSCALCTTTVLHTREIHSPRRRVAGMQVTGSSRGRCHTCRDTKVREGRLQFQGITSDGRQIFQQKRLDLMLGLDIALMSGKGQVSHVALVAGDSDFIPAVQVAKREGVSVWRFHGPRSGVDGSATYSSDLWREADERVEIDSGFIRNVRRA